MRRHVIMSLFVVLLAVTMLHSAADVQARDAKTILQKTDEVEGFTSMYSEMQQIITTSGGDKRTLVVRGWAVNNGEKQLSEYLSPADVKGQKMLMTDDGDNIWMYNPETRRTRKLGSHMKNKKVMGSDFTYEDQAGGKLIEKYTGTVLREDDEGGVLCYVMELTPTPKGPGYAKIVAWIGKDDFVTRRVDFYQHTASEPFKRLLLEDMRLVGEKPVAHTMTMTNLEDTTETINITTRVQFDVELPDSLFESRNLAR